MSKLNAVLFRNGRKQVYVPNFSEFGFIDKNTSGSYKHKYLQVITIEIDGIDDDSNSNYGFSEGWYAHKGLM